MKRCSVPRKNYLLGSEKEDSLENKTPPELFVLYSNTSKTFCLGVDFVKGARSRKRLLGKLLP